MEKGLVSVIIPVYNVEKYLEQCIESILTQTYKKIELLLIDDGSTDDSLQICNYYAEIDVRVVVIHQENQGVSVARNTGLNHAKGEFITFVDGDDYINVEMYDKMVAVSEGNDLVICGYNRMKETVKTFILDKEKLTREELFCHTFCSYLVSSSCWNKLFRKEIIEQRHIRFSIETIISEDTLFIANYYKDCKFATCILEPLYQYRCNPYSATQNTYLIKSFNYKKIAYLDVMENIENMYCSDVKYISDCIMFRTVRAALYLMFQMIVCKEYLPDLGIRINKIVRMRGKVYRKFPYSSRLESFVTILLSISPFFVYLVGVACNCFCKKIFNKYLL